jgi:hypothetical protein
MRIYRRGIYRGAEAPPTHHNSTPAQRERDAMSPTAFSIARLLQERVNRQPDADASTVITDDLAAAGCSESPMCRRLFQHSSAVADEFQQCGATRDRAAVITRQRLNYATAALPAEKAANYVGSLSTPEFSDPNEGVYSILRNESPALILTDSRIAPALATYSFARRPNSWPRVVGSNPLNLDSSRGLDLTVRPDIGLPSEPTGHVLNTIFERVEPGPASAEARIA